MTREQKGKMFEEFKLKMLELPFFEKDTALGWKLLNTQFRFIYYDFNLDKPELVWGYQTKQEDLDLLSVSFEHVLENCPEEIQEKLLFHLDLFR